MNLLFVKRQPAHSKAAPGDRSHIPANAMPVFEILSSDMQRVKARAPGSFKAQVDDAERRLNILFDHLNNEDLLKPNTVADMANLARAIQNRDYETARSIHVDIMTNRTDECGNWMVRNLSYRLRLPSLILMSITTGWCQASDWHEQGHAVNDIPLGCQGPISREYASPTSGRSFGLWA